MDQELLERIHKNPYTYQFLRIHSFYYKELLRDKKSIEKIEKLAKEELKEPLTSKIERLSKNLNTIQTIMDVMK